MNKKQLSDLTDYISGANEIARKWLQQIDDDQWRREVASSFNSIERTAIHIAGAEKVWIDFWTKAANPMFLSSEFKGTKGDLIEIWEKSSADLKKFVETLPEEDIFKSVDFVYPNGKRGQMLFWQTFLHFMNHATYHRGQMVTLLRQVGFTRLNNTDLATYFLTHK